VVLREASRLQCSVARSCALKDFSESSMSTSSSRMGFVHRWPGYATLVAAFDCCARILMKESL
jgi:hypothetical protein